MMSLKKIALALAATSLTLTSLPALADKPAPTKPAPKMEFNYTGNGSYVEKNFKLTFPKMNEFFKDASKLEDVIAAVTFTKYFNADASCFLNSTYLYSHKMESIDPRTEKEVFTVLDFEIKMTVLCEGLDAKKAREEQVSLIREIVGRIQETGIKFPDGWEGKNEPPKFGGGVTGSN